jgi:hypothetical protein
MDRARRCFVSMSSGSITLPSGDLLDFDRLYRDAVAPAVEDIDLVSQRASSLVTTGTLSSAVIEAIARADVVIADVSSGDPTVYYELGIRHALASGVTLILAARGTAVPVDLQAGWPVLTYSVEDGGFAQRLRARIVETLRVRLESGAVDSPVFELFSAQPSVLTGLPAETPERDRVESLRARLVEARQLLPEEGRARLKELEQDVAEDGIRDDRLSADLMLAYRDCSAWDDVIRLIGTFPEHLQESAIVVQQNALAHNRRGLPGDAERASAALESFIDRFGPDSESYGLLGRIHKDRYQRTGDRRDLDAAIDAYRRGLQAEPSDLYPGVNLVTLLTVAGGSAAEQEVREVLPRLRAILRDQSRAARLDYWDVATDLELAVIAGDWEAVDGLVDDARARAAADWMLETTINNLRILADAMPDSRVRIERLIKRLTPEVTVP